MFRWRRRQGDMLVPIIQQIALANESLHGGSIVILTETPKLELEEVINAAGLNLYGSGL
jgi:nitrogen fixation protein